MITLNYVVRKHDDVSPDDFRNFWLNEHSEKSLQLAGELGIRKYVKCETLFEDELHKLLVQIYGTATDGYDFVDQMHINDLELFKSGLAREEVCEAIIDLHKSCNSYVNFSRSDYWLSIEIPQVFSRESYVATDDTNYMKVFYVPQRLPGLSLAQAQLHWINCHGTLARQFIKRLPFDKYIQGHRVESKVIDDFKSMLGDEFENLDTNIGQAEAWLARSAPDAMNDPEAERMMHMLTEDIELFVNPGLSHYLGTREHIILDEPVITEPLPTLFSLD